MELSGIFLLLSAALMTVVVTRWIDRAKRGRISDFNQNLVLFAFAIMMLFFRILRPLPLVEQIGWVTLSLMVLIFLLNRIIGGSERIQEEARIWMGWTVFWLGVTGLMALVMDQLTTKRESEGLIIIVAVAVFTPVCSWGTTKKKDKEEINL